MKVFTYFDNSLPPHLLADSPILIEVEADSIVEADKIVERETGVVPAKTPSIGCAINDRFSFDPLDL